MLFICGCPRSGTTALWRLLTAHPRIVLGVERYVLFAYQKGKITPSLFQREKFFQIEKGETFYADLVGFNPYYETARDQYDRAHIIGDKIPELYRDYPGINSEFPDACILFIIRNIFDVAESYERRARDENDVTWNHKRDFRAAVSDWQLALASTLEFMNSDGRKVQLHIISYEDLFLQRADISRLFSAVKMELVPEVHARYERMLVRSKVLEAQRGGVLNSNAQNHIALHARFDLYRRLHRDRLAL
jgi:hypothetical protein